MKVLLAALECEGFHPRTREEYMVEDRVRKGRVVRDIFFMSDKQIRLARRFVSGFIYETDATFRTNTLRLPLLVMVGIDNTGATFPMAYMFITSESAESFRFTSRQLTDLCFYDYPKAAVICGDFSKGLGLAIALKAREDAELAGRL
jgi:MULE transposase domain